MISIREELIVSLLVRLAPFIFLITATFDSHMFSISHNRLQNVVIFKVSALINRYAFKLKVIVIELLQLLLNVGRACDCMLGN